MRKDRKIGVIGLGYVGLPLALAFARKFSSVVGFDISESKVNQIEKGIDPTDEGHSVKKHKKMPSAVRSLPEETPGYDIEPRQVHAPLGLDPAENRQKMRDAYGDDYYEN